MEHLNRDQLNRYAGGQIRGAELLAADDHLAECAACRDLLAAGDSVAVSLLVSEEPDHPDFEELADFVDGALTGIDYEVLEGHLEACGQCRDEVGDLRAFRAQMSAQPRMEYRPEAERTSPTIDLAPRTRRRAWLPWATALVAASVALVFWFQGADLRRQLALSSYPTTSTSDRERIERAIAEARELRERMDTVAEQLASERTARRLAEERARELEIVAGGGTAPPPPTADRPPTTAPPRRPQLARGEPPLSELPPPSVRRLQGEAGVLLGGTREGMPIPLTAPVGTRVASLRPTLRWEAIPSALRYTVALANERGDLVAQSGALTDTSWTPEVDLQPGTTYTWQVVAQTADGEVASPVPPAPEARFSVLTTDEMRRVRFEERVRLVDRARHLARLGLLDDAEAALSEALRMTPDAPDLRAEYSRLLQWRRGASVEKDSRSPR